VCVMLSVSCEDEGERNNSPVQQAKILLQPCDAQYLQTAGQTNTRAHTPMRLMPQPVSLPELGSMRMNLGLLSPPAAMVRL
jgi:hypothetical protein